MDPCNIQDHLLPIWPHEPEPFNLSAADLDLDGAVDRSRRGPVHARRVAAMPLRRQEDVADLGEQLGLDPRPLEAPAHTSPAVVTVRLVPHRSDAPGWPEVGPGSPSEGSAKFRIRSGTELPPGDESPERQESLAHEAEPVLGLMPRSALKKSSVA